MIVWGDARDKIDYTFGSDRRCNPEAIKQKPGMVPLKSDISPKGAACVNKPGVIIRPKQVAWY